MRLLTHNMLVCNVKVRVCVLCFFRVVVLCGRANIEPSDETYQWRLRLFD